MILFLQNKKATISLKSIAIFIVFAFCLSTFTVYITKNQSAYASALPYMPPPTKLIGTSADFLPATIKGIKFYKEDPFRFDFIIDEGNTKYSDQQLKEESQRLIEYFLTSLTTPKEDLWVNLSPHESDRVIPKQLGLTDMGRDMLGEDYVLKQLASSLTYPESQIGKEFWAKIYEKTYEKYGTTNIPTDTYNKVWVIPQKAVVYEEADGAFLGERSLKVMMEEDYIAQQQNTVGARRAVPSNNISSQIAKEIILPMIEDEINHGAQFAHLRQIYDALILATWFKKRLRQTIDNRPKTIDRSPVGNGPARSSVLDQIYFDKNKIKGVEGNDPQIKEKIYNQYVEAYKKGVYNYIKKDYDSSSRKHINRRYYSGGEKLDTVGDVTTVEPGKGVSADGPNDETTIEARLEAQAFNPERDIAQLTGYLEALHEAQPRNEIFSSVLQAARTAENRNVGVIDDFWRTFANLLQADFSRESFLWEWEEFNQLVWLISQSQELNKRFKSLANTEFEPEGIRGAIERVSLSPNIEKVIKVLANEYIAALERLSTEEEADKTQEMMSLTPAQIVAIRLDALHKVNPTNALYKAISEVVLPTEKEITKQEKALSGWIRQRLIAIQEKYSKPKPSDAHDWKARRVLFAAEEKAAADTSKTGDWVRQWLNEAQEEFVVARSDNPLYRTVYQMLLAVDKQIKEYENEFNALIQRRLRDAKLDEIQINVDGETRYWGWDELIRLVRAISQDSRVHDLFNESDYDLQELWQAIDSLELGVEGATIESILIQYDFLRVREKKSHAIPDVDSSEQALPLSTEIKVDLIGLFSRNPDSPVCESVFTAAPIATDETEFWAGFAENLHLVGLEKVDPWQWDELAGVLKAITADQGVIDALIEYRDDGNIQIVKNAIASSTLPEPIKIVADVLVQKYEIAANAEKEPGGDAGSGSAPDFGIEGEDNSIVSRFQHEALIHFEGQFAVVIDDMARELEEDSKGKITVEEYPQGHPFAGERNWRKAIAYYGNTIIDIYGQQQQGFQSAKHDWRVYINKKDGTLVYQNCRFKKKHSGRSRLAVYATNEWKVHHELTELRSWREYAISKKLISEDILQAVIDNSDDLADAGIYLGDVLMGYTAANKELVKKLRRQFHEDANKKEKSYVLEIMPILFKGMMPQIFIDFIDKKIPLKDLFFDYDPETERVLVKDNTLEVFGDGVNSISGGGLIFVNQKKIRQIQQKDPESLFSQMRERIRNKFFRFHRVERMEYDSWDQEAASDVVSAVGAFIDTYGQEDLYEIMPGREHKLPTWFYLALEGIANKITNEIDKTLLITTSVFSIAKALHELDADIVMEYILQAESLEEIIAIHPSHEQLIKQHEKGAELFTDEEIDWDFGFAQYGGLNLKFNKFVVRYNKAMASLVDSTTQKQEKFSSNAPDFGIEGRDDDAPTTGGVNYATIEEAVSVVGEGIYKVQTNEFFLTADSVGGFSANIVSLKRNDNPDEVFTKKRKVLKAASIKVNENMPKHPNRRRVDIPLQPLALTSSNQESGQKSKLV